MADLSSMQVAKKLGISAAVLSKYIRLKKVPAPRVVQVGRLKVQAWNEQEIEHLRRLLPKIANGRKTRFQKKQSALSNQHSAKARTKETKKKK